jgi:hypothetical protein
MQRNLNPVSLYGATLLLPEQLRSGSASYQGTTLQAAEKLSSGSVLYQGTTLVVPQAAEMKRRALAPEELCPISVKPFFETRSCQADPPLVTSIPLRRRT